MQSTTKLIWAIAGVSHTQPNVGLIEKGPSPWAAFISACYKIHKYKYTQVKLHYYNVFDTMSLVRQYSINRLIIKYVL